MKKLFLGFALLTSVLSSPSFADQKTLLIEDAGMCDRTYINTEYDLTLALSKIGIDAYNINCDGLSLSLDVVYKVEDVPTNVKTEILEQNKDGYSEYFITAVNETISKISFSLGYKASFSPIILKGKSHLGSRIFAEINPLNIPGAIFPGMFGMIKGQSDEPDLTIGHEVTLARFRKN